MKTTEAETRQQSRKNEMAATELKQNGNNPSTNSDEFHEKSEPQRFLNRPYIGSFIIYMFQVWPILHS